MPRPVFRARFLSECPTCSSPIERGEAAAYRGDIVVHAVHHDDPVVRDIGERMAQQGPRPPKQRRRRPR